MKEEEIGEGEVWTKTVLTRTVETPSCIARDQVVVTKDAGSTSVDATTGSCEVVSDNQHKPGLEGIDRSAGSSTQPGWQLGTPYFRSDGPVGNEPPRQSDYQSMDRNQMMRGKVGSNMYGPTVQTQMGSTASGHYVTGQYGPMSNMGVQPGFTHHPTDTIQFAYGSGMMGASSPMMYGTSPPSSGHTSPYTPPRYPHGDCTPLADADPSGWERFPLPTPTNMQHNARQMELAAWDAERDRRTDDTEMFLTPLAKPQPKRKRKHVQEMHTHAERVMVAADAARLWARLDEDVPSGPRNPKEGFDNEVLRIASRGREHVRICMERGTTAAQPNWGSALRTCRHHGEDEEELFAEHRTAVHNYAQRHDRRLK